MEKENLYFIAIIPGKEICDAITAFKLDFAHHFESRKALKVMPHITLKTPFLLPASRHPDLLLWFQKLSFSECAFQIELKNFGAFRNRDHPVVFVQPIMNTPLFSLQKEIIRSFHISFPEWKIISIEQKFRPHITVAYRDLKTDQFIEAWKIYQSKEYKAVFDVNGFHLLQHDGERWNIIDTYYFN